MNWKPLFEPSVLQQGQACCSRLAVQDMHITDTGITASVADTETYKVAINISHGSIESMSCTCPSAGRRNCRHMAAVLFASQDSLPETEASPTEDASNWKDDVLPDFPEMTRKPSRENSLAELVHNADELTVRAFLYSVLKEDPALQKRFRLLTQNVLTAGLLKNWKTEIDRIFDDAAEDGHIPSARAMDFTGALYSFLSSLDTRISASTALGIFKTIDYTLSKLQATDMDDSDGGLWCLFDFCYQIIGKLLPYCQEADRLSIFDWAASQLDCTPQDGKWHELAQSCAMQLILQQFSSAKYMDKKLALTDKEVKKAAQQPDYEQVILPNKIRTHILLMEQKGCSAAEQASYIRQYQHYGAVCLLLSEFYQQHQDDGSAISVLEAAYTDSSTPSYIARQCCEALKELYKKTGCRERYIQMLWDLALNIHVDNIELYKELKHQYTPEEWQQKREKILSSWGTNPYAGQLYAEEKLYGRLLQYVQHHRRLAEVQQYEDVLKTYYPAELLQLYTEILSDMAVQGADRKRYAYMVRLLRKMQHLPGGPQRVQAIAGQWRQQYKRRRAMMEELDKLT